MNAFRKARPFVVPARERGMALIVVVFVSVIVLVGGLAAVAVVVGDLGGARGFRTRATSEMCAISGLKQVQAAYPSNNAVSGTFDIVSPGGATGITSSLTMTYAAGHYDGHGSQAWEEVPPDQYDLEALFEGENITNRIGMSQVSGGSSAVDALQRLVIARGNVVCDGPGHGRREMEAIYRFGSPMIDR